MDLADRLAADDRRPTVTALPDGSVDTTYRVFDGDERVRTRAGFAEAVVAGDGAFAVERRAVEPGGHAVNMAMQADRLGDDVTLAGHLDDPAFEDLPFGTVSMGAPARVAIYGFDDGDVLAVENSDAIDAWTLDDLRAAADAWPGRLAADVVFVANWGSFDALPAALPTVADAVVDDGHLVFDPGAMGGRDGAEVRSLFDVLEALENPRDVVLAANPDEVLALAAALGVDARASAVGHSTGATGATLAGLRDAADLSGVVLHGAELAAAATPDRRLTVENHDVEPVRKTGGGDRFDAGMAHALARGWGWRAALRLGNACASRYVATGETGSADELAGFVRERER